MVGRLAYREDGDLIDCQRMGVGGKAIPPNVDKVSIQFHTFESIQAAHSYQAAQRRWIVKVCTVKGIINMLWWGIDIHVGSRVCPIGSWVE